MKEPLNEQFKLVDFESCHAVWSGDELAIGNELIERKWRVIDGRLYAVSIKDAASGFEWIAEASRYPAPCPAGGAASEPAEVSLHSSHGRMSPVEEASLVIELSAARAAGTLKYRFQVFPAAAAIRVQLLSPDSDTSSPADYEAGPESTGVEPAKSFREPVPVSDCMENFVLGPRHIRIVEVELRDQTDMHDELVFEKEWLPQFSEWDVALKGNLFVVEDSLSAHGLIFLKHAPLPHARPVASGVDFTFAGRSRQLTLRGNGIGAGEGYPLAVLAYSGGRFGRIDALQRYQRQLRAFVPGRDGLFLSNTWGDRSRDARINEEFMTREIEAGARLGVEVIQVDDGWQRGVTANSALADTAGGVWTGFWKADPKFWDAHPERFPRGIGEMIALARQRGMQFGLWFAPDSSDDFANWGRDADRLLELHRKFGVCYFKIDGVKVHSRIAEQNLQHLFDKVLDASNGRAVFDLDVTAESRPGYYGLVNCGPLFVENRYTDWHNYWPHQTLRNLWKLAHYIDPSRLRMEFLNQERNLDIYGDDPLAPVRYRPDYLFATVMFSNPLGWFETSNLPLSYFEQVAPLADTWKRHRDAIFAGRIYPVGEAPDGTAWTGFVSVTKSGLYALLFRELNEREDFEFQLPGGLTGLAKSKLLAGEGSVAFSDGKLAVRIGSAQRFIFAHLKES